jgi:hypothetical protein
MTLEQRVEKLERQDRLLCLAAAVTLGLIATLAGCDQRSSGQPLQDPEATEAARQAIEEERKRVEELWRSKMLSKAERMCQIHHSQAKVWEVVEGKPPETLGEMDASAPPGEGDSSRVAADQWGNDYWLQKGENGLRVWSRGPDGEKGTADDICYPPKDADERGTR